jgi:hypothetical protein
MICGIFIALVVSTQQIKNSASELALIEKNNRFHGKCYRTNRIAIPATTYYHTPIHTPTHTRIHTPLHKPMHTPVHTPTPDPIFVVKGCPAGHTASSLLKQHQKHSPDILKFCKDNYSKVVNGDQQCWGLVLGALKYANCKPPDWERRSLGVLIYSNMYKAHCDQPRIGDMIQYRNAKFKNGIKTGYDHSSVIIAIKGDVWVIAEQNSGGKLAETTNEINKNELISGSFNVFRPIGK